MPPQDKLVRWPPQQFISATFFARCQLALDATFCFLGYFVGTATWSQVGGYHANGGYKGVTRPPGRAVPVANHHQPNNCPACLAAQEVPLAYLQHLWVPRVPMGTFAWYLWVSLAFSTVVFWAPQLLSNQNHHGHHGCGHPGGRLPTPPHDHHRAHHIVFAAQASQHLFTATTISFLTCFTTFSHHPLF